MGVPIADLFTDLGRRGNNLRQGRATGIPTVDAVAGAARGAARAGRAMAAAAPRVDPGRIPIVQAAQSLGRFNPANTPNGRFVQGAVDAGRNALRPSMPGLPPEARDPRNYPVGTPGRVAVGGGNAGASTAEQWSPVAAGSGGQGARSGARSAAPQRSMPSQRSTPIPNPAPMPGFGTAQVQIPANRGRAAALNAAAQQAGAGVRYAPLADDAGIAVAERARMIQEARAAGSPTPANLTPASENYYQQADIAAWGAKNPELLRALRSRNGLPEAPTGGAFAPAPAAFGARFDERMNRAGAYGMQSDLAPGAAQAASGQAPSFGGQAVTDRTSMAFDPGLGLQRGQAAADFPMASVSTQTAFDPNLDLMGRSGAPGFPAGANVPVRTAFNPGLDLAPRQPQAASLDAPPPRQEASAAQSLNERYLRQIRGMKPSGMRGLDRLASNPQTFNPNASLF